MKINRSGIISDVFKPNFFERSKIYFLFQILTLEDYWSRILHFLPEPSQNEQFCPDSQFLRELAQNSFEVADHEFWTQISTKFIFFSFPNLLFYLKNIKTCGSSSCGSTLIPLTSIPRLESSVFSFVWQIGSANLTVRELRVLVAIGSA